MDGPKKFMLRVIFDKEDRRGTVFKGLCWAVADNIPGGNLDTHHGVKCERVHTMRVGLLESRLLRLHEWRSSVQAVSYTHLRAHET